MLRLFPILTLCLVAGCSSFKPSPFSGAAGIGIAKAQQSIANAAWNTWKAEPHTDRVGKAYLDAASHEHATAQRVLEVAAKNESRSRDDCEAQRQVAIKDHAANEWFGWHLRRYFWLIVGAWAAVGIAGIVTGVVGLTTVSAFIMRLLPFSNLFAFARDKIIDARSPVVVNVMSRAPDA